MSGELENMMLENPQLRWSFIWKVYSIVAFQLLLTIAVVSVFVFFSPVASFLNNLVKDYVFYIILILEICSVNYYHQKHPLSYFLLLSLTVSSALPVGFICALTNGTIILEAVIFTTIAVVFSLTLYTFWAAKRGHNFSFLYPYLFGDSLLLILFIPIQMLFPLGKSSYIIFWCLSCVIICCGYIICNTDSLIKSIPCAQYILASTSLYLDVIKLFLSLSLLYSMSATHL
ncbi:hypothetical protein P8452_02048 [Trifolium repens]|nr:hypothetical protein P8452_02048 [Trifolium repens]